MAIKSPLHGLSFLGVKTWCFWETALVQNVVVNGVETGTEQADCKEIEWDSGFIVVVEVKARI